MLHHRRQLGISDSISIGLQLLSALDAVCKIDVDCAGDSHVDAYSPVTNTWPEVVSLPSARGGHAAVVAKNGQIWVLGGSMDLGGSTLHAGADVYGPGLTISSPIVAKGGAIDVTGKGFSPNSVVHLYLDDKNTPVASATADALGGLGLTKFKVPATAGTGGHEVLAIDELSRYR